jgi:hypothetical protein
MGINDNLDNDASGNIVDQKLYDWKPTLWPHQDWMSCLVCACVQDFKPHQEKVIWRLQREYWG